MAILFIQVHYYDKTITFTVILVSNTNAFLYTAAINMMYLEIRESLKQCRQFLGNVMDGTDFIYWGFIIILSSLEADCLQVI